MSTYQVEVAQGERFAYSAIVRTESGVRLDLTNGDSIDVPFDVSASELFLRSKAHVDDLVPPTGYTPPIPELPTLKQHWTELLYWLAVLESGIADFGRYIWYEGLRHDANRAWIVLSDGLEIGTYVVSLQTPEVVTDVATDAAVAFIEHRNDMTFHSARMR